MQLESLHRESDINLSVKQAEIDKLQQKLFTNEQFSSEKSLKKRLELEIPYRLELESKDMEMEKQRDFGNNLTRENESLKTRLETMRYDWENDMRNLKKKHKIEINELKLHISAFQTEKEYEKSSGEVIREKNREIEDLKRKLQEKEGFIVKLRKEKTEIMDSHFSQYETLKKMLEIEKLEKRNLMIEKDRPMKEEGFGESYRNNEDIYVYYEQKYEKVRREKEGVLEEIKEIREKLKRKDEEIKEKDEKIYREQRENGDFERDLKEVIKEKERLLEENVLLNERIRVLKGENEVFNEKNKNYQQILEENEKFKEKIKKYKEKLKLANEKIMGFLEEKMRNNTNNTHTINNANKDNNINNTNNNNVSHQSIKKAQKENDSKIIMDAYNGGQNNIPQRSFYDLTNLRIVEDNRILREKAKRFTQNLLME